MLFFRPYDALIFPKYHITNRKKQPELFSLSATSVRKIGHRFKSMNLWLLHEQNPTINREMFYSLHVVQFRIEIHILSLHWMMKNINYFNVCVARASFKY